MLFYLCPFCSPRLIQNSFTGLELLSSQTPYQALKTNPTKPHKENWMVATKTLSFSLSASLFHSAVNQQCMISITAVWSNCQVRQPKILMKNDSVQNELWPPFSKRNALASENPAGLVKFPTPLAGTLSTLPKSKFAGWKQTKISAVLHPSQMELSFPKQIG